MLSDVTRWRWASPLRPACKAAMVRSVKICMSLWFPLGDGRRDELDAGSIGRADGPIDANTQRWGWAHDPGGLAARRAGTRPAPGAGRARGPVRRDQGPAEAAGGVQL